MPTMVIDRIYQWVQPRTLPARPRSSSRRVDIAFAEYGDPGGASMHAAAFLPNSRHLGARAGVSLMVSS